MFIDFYPSHLTDHPRPVTALRRFRAKDSWIDSWVGWRKRCPCRQQRVSPEFGIHCTVSTCRDSLRDRCCEQDCRIEMGQWGKFDRKVLESTRAGKTDRDTSRLLYSTLVVSYLPPSWDLGSKVNNEVPEKTGKLSVTRA